MKELTNSPQSKQQESEKQKKYLVNICESLSSYSKVQKKYLLYASSHKFTIKLINYYVSHTVNHVFDEQKKRRTFYFTWVFYLSFSTVIFIISSSNCWCLFSNGSWCFIFLFCFFHLIERNSHEIQFQINWCPLLLRRCKTRKKLNNFSDFISE
jgi:hypothetical protein